MTLLHTLPWEQLIVNPRCMCSVGYSSLSVSLSYLSELKRGGWAYEVLPMPGMSRDILSIPVC